MSASGTPVGPLSPLMSLAPKSPSDRHAPNRIALSTRACSTVAPYFDRANILGCGTSEAWSRSSFDGATGVIGEPDGTPDPEPDPEPEADHVTQLSMKRISTPHAVGAAQPKPSLVILANLKTRRKHSKCYTLVEGVDELGWPALFGDSMPVDHSISATTERLLEACVPLRNLQVRPGVKLNNPWGHPTTFQSAALYLRGAIASQPCVNCQRGTNYRPRSSGNAAAGPSTSTPSRQRLVASRPPSRRPSTSDALDTMFMRRGIKTGFSVSPVLDLKRVDTIVYCYAMMAKCNTVLLSQSLTKVNRDSITEILLQSRKSFQRLFECTATAASSNFKRGEMPVSSRDTSRMIFEPGTTLFAVKDGQSCAARYDRDATPVRTEEDGADDGTFEDSKLQYLSRSEFDNPA
ncbi:hypothetical protein BDR22DRAFT_894481 [Usnea florida]